MGEMTQDHEINDMCMVYLKVWLKIFMVELTSRISGRKPLVCGRNDTCTQSTLKWLCFMDIKMKNFYSDLFQRLNVGAFTRYVTFHKR